PTAKFHRAGVWNGSERTSFAWKLKAMARWSALSSAQKEISGRYSRSRACKLRGGPKISRKMIASRKPDFDASKIAMPVFKSAPLGTARVAAAEVSIGVLIAGGGSIGNGPS